MSLAKFRVFLAKEQDALMLSIWESVLISGTVDFGVGGCVLMS